MSGRREFVAVPKGELRAGDQILVPSSPGFALVTVEKVERHAGIFGPDVAVTVLGRNGRTLQNVSTHLGDSSHFGDAWRLA